MGLACAALVTATPGRARACSCRAATLAERLERADAVFEGRVLSVTRVPPPAGRDAPGAGALRAEVEVVQTWKGADRERVTVVTAEAGARCGVELTAGRSYLVFASADEDALATGLCDGTRLREDAEDDVAALGAGVTPVDIAPGADEAPGRGGSGAGRGRRAGRDEADGDAPRRAEPSLRERRRGARTIPPGSGGCAGCAVAGRSVSACLALGLAVGLASGLAARRAARGGLHGRRRVSP
jgi:hypothetical protein